MSSPPPAVLVLGALYREPSLWEQARLALEGRFGPLEEEMLKFPFDGTDYYDDEMGPGLTRLFCSFRDPVRQDTLADCKLWTEGLECELALAEGRGRRRRVNLDPGLLCLEKLVLASTKDFSHRICLRDGIFAEVSLLCRDGGFQTLPWTYPDYRRGETLDFFNSLRLHWRRRLRKGAAGD